MGYQPIMQLSNTTLASGEKI